MTTDIALLNNALGAGTDLAAALGFSTNTGAQSTLPELRQLYKAQKGEMEVKGKKMIVETIPGGSYSLTTSEGNTIYSETVTVRIFMQRFQYQRFEKFAAPVDGKDGKMFRTVMANSFREGDLKDNYGGFNCGRPGGYIKDYDSLSGPLRDIVKNTKRVMVVFGTVTMDNPTDANGNPVEAETSYPFFMRVKNAKSYKAIETATSAITKRNMLPIQRQIRFSHDSVPLPNGELNYFVKTEDVGGVQITAEDADYVNNFIEWVKFNNEMILKLWAAVHEDDISKDEQDLMQQFVEIGDDRLDDDIPF